MENKKQFYIVYCTINKVNKYIYIGVHGTNNPHEFDGYYGCGVNKFIPSSYKYPKTKFQYAIKQFGFKNFERITIQIFNNSEDAYLLESQIVNEDFLKRQDVYNMILGGGTSSVSQKIYQYDLDGNFMNEYSSIVEAAKKNKCNKTSINRAATEKVKCKNSYWSKVKYDVLNLNYYKTEDVNRGICVYQYDKNGKYECCYDSIRDASRILGVNHNNLMVSIKLGTKCNNKYFLDYFSDSFVKAKNEKIKNTIVYQYDLNGNFIKEWESANKARKSLGFTSDIYKAIKIGRTAGGFQWSLEKIFKLDSIKPKSGKARKIGKYDKNGNLICVYNTLNECRKIEGKGVHHNLSGRDKTYKNFIYKYIN